MNGGNGAPDASPGQNLLPAPSSEAALERKRVPRRLLRRGAADVGQRSGPAAADRDTTAGSGAADPATRAPLSSAGEGTQARRAAVRSRSANPRYGLRS